MQKHREERRAFHEGVSQEDKEALERMYHPIVEAMSLLPKAFYVYPIAQLEELERAGMEVSNSVAEVISLPREEARSRRVDLMLSSFSHLISHSPRLVRLVFSLFVRHP